MYVFILKDYSFSISLANVMKNPRFLYEDDIHEVLSAKCSDI